MKAENGNVKDAIELGYMYLIGTNFVDRNKTAAFFWFHKAATEKSSYAQNIIGNFYAYGFVNNINNKKAAEWFLLASKNGSELGKNNFKKISNLLTDKQIQKIKIDVKECDIVGYRNCNLKINSSGYLFVSNISNYLTEITLFMISLFFIGTAFLGVLFTIFKVFKFID